MRRRLTGRGVAEPDCGHFHHGLQRRYAGPWPVLAAATLLSSIGAAGALAGGYRGDDRYPLSAAVAVVALLAATGWFGGHEVRLVAARLRGLARPLPVIVVPKPPVRSRRGSVRR